MAKLKRYYVTWSLWFCNHPYDIEKILKAVKQGGGKQIRTFNQFGWPNQPKVVCFNLGSNDDYLRTNTYNSILKCLQESFETNWIIISEKDWK
jgi:hypothetical protein